MNAEFAEIPARAEDRGAPKILIVDDHAAVRAGLRNLVSSRPGWVICGEAADGEEAVELATKLKPSAIVMDISMPNMDGLEATRRIRQNMPDAEIVIVSQHDSEQVVFEAQRAGARGFVVKSHLSADLLPALEAALRHSSRISVPVTKAWHKAIATSNENTGRTSLADPGPHDDLDLMSGGGEMGALMRAHDWSKTSLGPVSSWPQSLRTSLRICLDSRFPILIWWGPELRMLYNDAYMPALGKTKHPRALGAPGKEVWGEVWDTIGPMLESVMRTGQATWVNDQLLLFDRNGYVEETCWTYSYSAIRLPSGEVGGIFCAVHEVTDRVLHARRLKTLREVADQVVQAKSGEDACILAMQSIVRNPADCPFAMIFLVEDKHVRRMAASFPADEVVPRKLDSEGADPWAVQRVIQSQVSEVFPIENPEEMPRALFGDTCKKGISIPIITNRQVVAVITVGISPYREFDENYRGFLESLSQNLAANISNARAYEVERKRAEALAELDRAKTTFFSNVSHEFRTPLTLMLGPLEDVLARGADLPSTSREKLEVAQRNAIRLLKLVNTLLDFSRIEAGRVQASFEPVDLGKVTAELASVFRSAVERAGLRLIVDCEPLPEPVYVDREMWEKVILNLLSNALKFTFEGEIAVSLRPDGEKALLRVRDTGIGIAEDELPHLFERFHRIEGVRARSYEGSGIGLALVQELVRLHGGEITATSQLGEGTTFEIALRRGIDHLPKDRILARKTMASSAVRAAAYVQEAMEWIPGEEDLVQPEPGTMEQREVDASVRILLADDNADMRNYITRLLSTQWTVETAADGLSALRAAREQRPTLVITDVMMPGLDGFGLLKELRKDPATRSIPVIMLSARAGEESRVEGLHAGADDYIVKPFSARELVARVASQVSLRRLRARLDQQRTAIAQLFEQTPMPVLVLSGEELICISENAAQREAIGGRSLLGTRLMEAMPELQGQGLRELLLDVMRTGKACTQRELKIRIRRREGGKVEDSYWTCIFAPFAVEGSGDAVIALSADVTEQVASRTRLEQFSQSLEAEVRERTSELERRTAALMQHSQRVRDLTKRLLQVQEDERRHIARELHDSAGQTLAVLAMNLAQVVQAASQVPGPLAGIAAESEKLVQQLSNEIRTTSYLLHPPLLDERGLSAALTWYVEGLRERSDLDVSLDMATDFARLPRELELVVFRVVQECLTNIHRHSGSRTGRIRVERDHELLRVRVEDRGAGISRDRLAEIESGKSGVGIRGMRERLSHVGGKMEIESGADGTKILVTIPIGENPVQQQHAGLESLPAAV